MPEQHRFLLGHGQRLTDKIPPVGRDFKEPPPPYTFDEAKQRVAPMLTRAVDELGTLPKDACPDDYATALLTVHPQYTAKSFYPGKFLQAAHLEAVGSRPAKIVPEKLRGGVRPARQDLPPELMETVDLIVSGRRADLLALTSQLPYWQATSYGAEQLFEVEQFRAMKDEDRIQPINPALTDVLLEVVLHVGGQLGSDDVLEAFRRYVRKYDLKPDFNRRFLVGGLCFFPLQAPAQLISNVGQFSLVRALRSLPSLRPLNPVVTRSFRRARTIKCQLPAVGPLDPTLRAAVFDGGLVASPALAPFTSSHDPPGIGKPDPEFLTHGAHVTSAALFGHIPESGILPRPYSYIDHYRVLDEDSPNDPNELYDVLARIRDTLQSRREYAVVNISVGPDLPVEDHEVHAWTAVLDGLLADGDTLLTVAVGNSGRLDWDSGNARVQVPSDAVNSLAVGSCTSSNGDWERADYSSVGPGRSPGLVKPDIVAFGGTDSDPFLALNPATTHAVPTMGTSFACPLALRAGIGIRAHFGTSLSPLAIKALMIHCSEEHGKADRREVGWGRLPQSILDFVTCEDGEVRVVYQDQLTPGQYLRTPIPLPRNLPNVRVEIRATFCIGSVTDPQDPSNYTRSGLDITYRPHTGRRGKNSGTHPATAPFFRGSDYDPEHELRHNAHKWETVLHAKKRQNADSMQDPAFDVHYQTRLAGHPSRGTSPIKYALIVTISAPKVKDLYDRVVQRYQTILEPLRPVVEIPIRV